MCTFGNTLGTLPTLFSKIAIFSKDITHTLCTIWHGNEVEPIQSNDMYKIFCVCFLMAILGISCQNSGKQKAPVKESIPEVQNQKPENSLPDITGVYRLPETHCDLVITFIKEANGFRYYIKGEHLEGEGKAVVSSEQGEIYVTFDGPTGGNNKPNTLSGLYTNNTLTIQNTGNAQNQYTFFEDCPDKYLEFKKN